MNLDFKNLPNLQLYQDISITKYNRLKIESNKNVHFMVLILIIKYFLNPPSDSDTGCPQKTGFSFSSFKYIA